MPTFLQVFDNDLTGTAQTGVWDLVQNNAGETCTNSVFASLLLTQRRMRYHSWC